MNPRTLVFSRPPREHQWAALERYAPEYEMALLWEMGTGKTTAAIGWLRTKYVAHGQVSRTLVVSPVATLYNWQNEFAINAPPRVADECIVPYMRTKRTKYTGKERAELIRTTEKKIIIINPDSLDNKEVVKALLDFRPVNVVVDEAHRFKNPRAARLQALLTITDRCENRAVLTGTPILNSYLDIWAQWRILDRGATFGLNFYSFREAYFRDANIAWKGKPKYFPHYVPKADSAGILSTKIEAKASRLRKEDCLDLPPLTFETRYVELSNEQAKAYFEMESQLLTEVAEGTCAATNALSRVLRMLQILSGYVPVERDGDNADASQLPVHFDEVPRLAELRDLLEELTPSNKVIVWANFKENYKRIRELCAALSLPMAELTSDTQDRQAELDRFQNDPACRVMLSNPQAGGVGVNMTAAKYAIYYSRNYSLGDRKQSEARNHRGGSEIHDRITIIDLVAKDTLDEDVLAALLRKEQFSDNVLERLRRKLSHAK